MKKAIQISVMALFLIGLVGISAFAFGGHGFGKQGKYLEDITYEELQEKAQAAGKELPFTAEEFAAKKEQMDQMRAEREAKMDAIETAIESGDVSALQKAAEGTPFAEVATAENMDELQRLLELRSQQEALMEQMKPIHEEMKSLAESIGLNPMKQGQGERGMKGMDMHSGFHQGFDGERGGPGGPRAKFGHFGKGFSAGSNQVAE